jgi:hypothetical protein
MMLVKTETRGTYVHTHIYTLYIHTNKQTSTRNMMLLVKMKTCGNITYTHTHILHTRE